MTRLAKKSETIEVRLPLAAKQAFATQCRSRGVTMSAAIRGLIQNKPRGRIEFLWPAVTAGAIALAVLVTPAASAPDFGAGFDALDGNRDGVVTATELPANGRACSVPFALPLARTGLGNGPRGFAVCRDEPGLGVLDLNRDGLVTRQEYADYRLATFRKGYEALDLDGNGTLEAAEYAATGRIAFQSDRPALAQFRDLDRNGDGRVSFDEYLR